MLIPRRTFAAMLVLTLAACSNDAPTVATPTNDAPGLNASPASGDLGGENGASADQVLIGTLGSPLHLIDPSTQSEADWTVNSFTLRKPHDNYTKPGNAAYLVANVTVRVTKGKWEVNILTLSVAPDADTGVPMYEAALMVDGMGDRDLYSGYVPTGKHITGEVYFDVPKGKYWMTLTEGNVNVGFHNLAQWRYEG